MGKNASMTPMQTYIEFVCKALLGGNPKETDSFLEKNKDAIYETAKLMHEKHPIESKTLYRGILLEPQYSKNLVLDPMPNVKYLSFSESKDLALTFADTEDFMSQFVMERRPESRGYLIEYKPDLDEILFHYSWFDVLGLDMNFSSQCVKVIEEQQEVTLKQGMQRFKLIPV